MSAFARFLLVGAVGFAVDLGVFLLLLHATQLAPPVARIVCFVPAVLTTWWLNRTFTFHGHGLPRLPLEATLYALIQATGASINFGVFYVVASCITDTRLGPLIAFASGSAAALFFNFTVARFALYRRAKEAKPSRSCDPHHS